MTNDQQQNIHPIHQIMYLDHGGRTFVCGDLHGCYDLLMNGLAEVQFNTLKDRLIVLGDIVDRGPDSYQCLKLVKKPWFHAIKGNHEEMMLNAMPPLNDWRMWFDNGGYWYRELPGEQWREEVHHLCEQYIEHLPLSMTLVYPRTEDGQVHHVGLIHGDAPDDWFDAIEGKHIAMAALWGRRRAQYEDCRPVENIDLVLCGHTSQSRIRQLGNVIYLDTGAGWQNGRLTLIELGNSLDELRQAIHQRMVADKAANHPDIEYVSVNPGWKRGWS